MSLHSVHVENGASDLNGGLFVGSVARTFLGHLHLDGDAVDEVVSAVDVEGTKRNFDRLAAEQL